MVLSTRFCDILMVSESISAWPTKIIVVRPIGLSLGSMLRRIPVIVRKRYRRSSGIPPQVVHGLTDHLCILRKWCRWGYENEKIRPSSSGNSLPMAVIRGSYIPWNVINAVDCMLSSVMGICKKTDVRLAMPKNLGRRFPIRCSISDMFGICHPWLVITLLRPL